MKVCIVAEGCYPYVVGGVSGWIHSMIQAFPQVQFILLTICSDRAQSGKFVYTLPDNVVSVYEAYLEDMDYKKKSFRKKKLHLSPTQYRALRGMIMNFKTDWGVLFDLFQEDSFSINDLLMGEDFLHIIQEYYEMHYPEVVFSDFLWTMRSIFLPQFLILNSYIPKADIYHCVATGYAGILGSMAKYFHHSGLLISEHGIYTREREEEILKAGWVKGIYKNIWMDQFKKMSKLAYDYADYVTALFGHARQLQIDLGCPASKTRITPNGIVTENFENLSGKKQEDLNYFQIGAVLRVTPIKDVKTMLRAFAYAKGQNEKLKLWIMGPCDEDPEYAKECYELVDTLKVKDVVFTGRVNVKEYLGRMDCTILTSISEGQPLTILESYAAHKPVIATDVGNCRELIYGEADDDLGQSGILTHIMNIQELAEAMLFLAENEEKRLEMGEVGYQRVKRFYQIGQMREKYQSLYEEIYRLAAED